ncbi:MAG: VPDSG-CTERM sorting domain-containing protein [Verrucomicrobiales bacterium]|nr:VPDSG-CTERM sorting domain-containing protein [Verrucomicrobiales bacterium]
MELAKIIQPISIAAAIFVSALSTHAVTISGLSETPDSLSFDFAGDGFLDKVQASLPPLTYWDFKIESHFQDPAAGTYGVRFFWQHLPDGDLRGVGGTGIPFGTHLSDTESVAHGAGVDTYSLNVTVNEDAQGAWGLFSGSFSATHTHPNGVPDSGSTGGLTSLVFLLLAGGRRLLAGAKAN